MVVCLMHADLASAAGAQQNVRMGADGALRTSVSVGCRASALLMTLFLPMAQAHAQSVSIPLQYVTTGTAWRLGVNVGINGGAPQLYMFDTGSAVFNAAFNPATWGGFGQTVPASAVPNGSGVNYCYAAGTCFTGNLVQVPVLNFYAPGAAAGAAPVATLGANPGYQVNAVYSSTGPNQTFPAYFQTTTTPPVIGTFYGIFGAGNFTQRLLSTGTVVGGVLGQTILPGVTQGYVVSANGQPNPGSYNAAGQPLGSVTNGPSGNQVVTIGGVSQPVSPTCIACVTVGLTPQLIGQFAPVGPPSQAGERGVVPARTSVFTFPNPYGGAVGNPSSTQYSANFIVTLTPSSGASVTQTNPTLLDTGTPVFALGSGSQGGSTSAGTTIAMAGALLSTASIPGLPPTTATLTGNLAGYLNTYRATISTTTTNNVIGIPFFMQNSVMFDLSDNVIGYTPFYVTAAGLATTANGPLIVSGSNVPLGLAGVVSGPGGITVHAGGQVQLSAANTYTGLTTIAGASGGTPAGLLLISGPGSIASSAGVVNNGVFDISRAWAPVGIQSLTGGGQVWLGGQNLVLSNASGTFSGTMADSGAYPATGGALTLVGGNFTFAGTGTYTGGTIVTGGNFTLSGSLIGGLTIMPNGSFAITPGGLLNNSGGTTLNFGQLAVGGTLISDLFNAGNTSNTGTITGNVMNNGVLVNNGTVNGFTYNTGTLSGSGLMAGSAYNAGVIAPGNSIGTLSIAANYTHANSATYTAQFNGAGQSDLINVGGMANLQGGIVNVFAQPGTNYAARTTYKILNAVGGINGSFGSTADPYPFLLPSLSYDANNAYLTLQIGGFAAAAATPTQQAVGTVLDANVNTATGDFAQVLSALATNTFTNTQGQYVLQQLSGNNYAGLSSSMVQGAQLFMNNFAGQTGGTASLGGSRVAIAEACDVACDPNALPQWGAWGGGVGGFGTIGAQQPVGGVTYNAGGFAAGLDRMITPATRLGVTAGYTSGTQWVSGFAGQSKSDTFNVGLYGNYAQDKVYADALVGYAYSGNQMWRPISIPGLQPRTALGQTGANQWYGQVETGYRFDLGGIAQAFVTPFARLQAYTGTQNAFTETGAQSLNLSIAQQTTNSLRSVLGAQLGGAMDLGWREKLAMQFRLGWSHEYADVGRPVTATLAGAPAMPFTTWGVSPQRDGIVLGLSASTAIADATSIYLRYEGNIAGQDSAQAITAGVRMTW